MEHVTELRARFYGALEDVCSRQYAKNAKDGGWLAYEMLKDSGVIRDRGLHQQPSAAAPSSEEDEIRKIAVALVDGGLRRQRVFGLPIPDPVDYRSRPVTGCKIRTRPPRLYLSSVNVYFTKSK
jgi:hypothetical protein